MPWSIGWCTKVVEESIWLVGLAMRDLLYHVIQNYRQARQPVPGSPFSYCSWNHHLVSLPSFQVFFWLLYGRGDWRVRKQRGLVAFPIMASGISACYKSHAIFCLLSFGTTNMSSLLISEYNIGQFHSIVDIFSIKFDYSYFLLDFITVDIPSFTMQLSNTISFPNFVPPPSWCFKVCNTKGLGHFFSLGLY